MFHPHADPNRHFLRNRCSFNITILLQFLSIKPHPAKGFLTPFLLKIAILISPQVCLMPILISCERVALGSVKILQSSSSLPAWTGCDRIFTQPHSFTHRRLYTDWDPISCTQMRLDTGCFYTQTLCTQTLLYTEALQIEPDAFVHTKALTYQRLDTSDTFNTIFADRITLVCISWHTRRHCAATTQEIAILTQFLTDRRPHFVGQEGSSRQVCKRSREHFSKKARGQDRNLREDVKMRRCAFREDAWSWADAPMSKRVKMSKMSKKSKMGKREKMRRCENEKMWWEDVMTDLHY